jgi:hypothetical protein
MPVLDVPSTTPAPRSVDLERAAAALRASWPQLPTPVVLPWSDDPVLLLDGRRPWLYAPARRDPALIDGRAVVPRRQAKRLAVFAELGVPFCEVAIAHELDPAGPAKGLVPILEEGPRRCTDDHARALVGPVPPHPLAALTVRLLDALVRGTAGTTCRVLLDPILFGVVGAERPKNGELRMFVPLATWRW